MIGKGLGLKKHDENISGCSILCLKNFSQQLYAIDSTDRIIRGGQNNHCKRSKEIVGAKSLPG
jgi:hypothetical protein